jgi:hypothetical protein
MLVIANIDKFSVQFKTLYTFHQVHALFLFNFIYFLKRNHKIKII